MCTTQCVKNQTNNVVAEDKIIALGSTKPVSRGKNIEEYFKELENPPQFFKPIP